MFGLTEDAGQPKGRNNDETDNQDFAFWRFFNRRMCLYFAR
jgi:hypothetical protein